MKLSYIIPVYNVEQYLEQCINSILSQSISDYEIILIDDGSKDNSGKLCDEYSKKYNFIKTFHYENGGLPKARNRGLEKAKGEYIFFVDSDDCLKTNNVESLYNTAKQYNLDILNTSFYVSGNDKIYNTPFSENKLYSNEELSTELYHANMNRILIFVWRNMYKRSFLTDNNIIFSEEIRTVEDSVFNIQCFSKCQRFMAVNIPAYCYRLRDDSIQREKYKLDYDLTLQKQWELKNRYYKGNHSNTEAYDSDSAEFTLKVLLHEMLGNEYLNKTKDRYKKLKRIANSEMIVESFKKYDINEYKSKSLDWLTTLLIRKKRYFPAHLICDYILYKK